MARQRVDHGMVYVMPDDLPHRLRQLKEVLELKWTEIARRIGTTCYII